MPRPPANKGRNQRLRRFLSNNDRARAISPPTAQVVQRVTSKSNIPLRSEDIPNSDGGILHLIGDTSATKVLLYFHGGGYSLPGSDAHLYFLIQCQSRLRMNGTPLLIAFLEYVLTGVKRYPTQLIQATEALRLLVSKGYRPENIIIGGDSAGGNLALGLASVLSHPLDGTTPLRLAEPLAGALLISPWVSFESSAPSFEKNKDLDIVRADSATEQARNFAQDHERNNWNEPIRADVSWWENLPVRSILNLAGAEELFEDDIMAFGKTVAKAGLNIESVDCPDQIHIECILDATPGFETGSMAREVWRWLDSLFIPRKLKQSKLA